MKKSHPVFFQFLRVYNSSALPFQSRLRHAGPSQHSHLALVRQTPLPFMQFLGRHSKASSMEMFFFTHSLLQDGFVRSFLEDLEGQATASEKLPMTNLV